MDALSLLHVWDNQDVLDVERIQQPEVAAAFEAGREGDAYRFTNPTRVRTFQ